MHGTPVSICTWSLIHAPPAQRAASGSSLESGLTAPAEPLAIARSETADTRPSSEVPVQGSTREGT
jgi:hypothetical protein